MTAPDPGLTDLLAAHELNHESRDRNCLCGHRSWGTDTHAAHVALVVEQHTNGRTAELDWDELVAAIPEGWELRESTQLEEASRVRQRDLEASRATTARWRARAEKAEATVARAWAVIPRYSVQSGGKATEEQFGWLDGTKHVQQQLRAALEGEQQ